ncbi:MAG: hypothetical protein AB7O29_10740, partial [Acidimicrobiia bacterium]
WAMTATAGSALSGDALKVSAGLVRDLPLPSAGADWDEAAALVGEAGVAAGAGERGRCLDAAGAAMCRAYGVDADPVLGWWSARRPRR